MFEKIEVIRLNGEPHRVVLLLFSGDELEMRQSLGMWKNFCVSMRSQWDFRETFYSEFFSNF